MIDWHYERSDDVIAQLEEGFELNLHQSLLMLP